MKAVRQFQWLLFLQVLAIAACTSESHEFIVRGMDLRKQQKFIFPRPEEFPSKIAIKISGKVDFPFQVLLMQHQLDESEFAGKDVKAEPEVFPFESIDGSWKMSHDWYDGGTIIYKPISPRDSISANNHLKISVRLH